MGFLFDNSYARLPDGFFARVDPTPVAEPRLVKLNVPLAERLGLDPVELSSPAGVAALAGNLVPDGANPIALAYAGHQFGHFTPQLGDGRAILLGEIAGTDGTRRDIQLKGSGPTPFSRSGDGRAALGPVLREYLISEAMAALGIPTTRALAAVATGQGVRRETMLPGAVLTRVAASHIRVGTFQYFAARGDTDAIRTLADHAIARHYPEIVGTEHPYRGLLAGVVARQANLIARWLLIGFIHGVMNTDNTAISGETIDYGPCAFMDRYDPSTVFSSIDHHGRYAYGNQPRIAQWNLTRLAEAMLPLLGADDDAAVAAAKEVLGTFGPVFEAAYLGGLRAKIGLSTERDGDADLANDLLRRMAENNADFTKTFSALSNAAESPDHDRVVQDLFADPSVYDEWAIGWRARLGNATGAASLMRTVNPIVIPRNHLVEAALTAAMRGDLAPFEELLEAVSHPFEQRPGFARYAMPPDAESGPYVTYCGT